MAYTTKEIAESVDDDMHNMRCAMESLPTGYRKRLARLYIESLPYSAHATFDVRSYRGRYVNIGDTGEVGFGVA